MLKAAVILGTITREIIKGEGQEMSTEFEYGYEYAADQGTEPVDIEKMLTGSVDIPDGDYVEMKREGIENPDPREYWEGFNSYFD